MVDSLTIDQGVTFIGGIPSIDSFVATECVLVGWTGTDRDMHNRRAITIGVLNRVEVVQGTG